MKHLSRAAFLSILATKALSKPVITDRPVNRKDDDESGPVGSGLAPYTGTWEQKQLLHLLRRSLFGVTHDDHQFFSVLSLKESLDILLTPSPDAPPPVNAYNDSSYTDPDVPFGKTWVFCPFTDDQGVADQKRLPSLKAWWIGLLLNQDRSLTEKMTLFWHNHVSAEFTFTKDARTSYSYIAPLRKHAMGSFKKLILEVTTCSGMLQYLGGIESTAEAPNENYARELQELFTVGKGLGSHYTQADVVAAARILTGWTTDEAIYVRAKGEGAALSMATLTIKPNGIKTVFHHEWHDTGDKQFSSFYNNTIIKGKKGQAGRDETVELIDMIFATRETARHTCRGLYRWFINSTIDETIETNIIDPLSDLFIKSNFEIIPVLRTLLGSEHFFDPTNMGCYIKNPVDHLIGISRQYNLTKFPSDLSKQYHAWNMISESLGFASMCPGDPPNVAGWQAYYLPPSYYHLWINSDTIVARNVATDTLLSEVGMSDQNLNISLRLDVLAYTARCSDPADMDRLINDSTLLLSPIPFDATQTALLKNMLSTEKKGALSWQSVWAAYIAYPDDLHTKEDITDRLRKYYAYILQRGECQLI